MYLAICLALTLGWVVQLVSCQFYLRPHTCCQDKGRNSNSITSCGVHGVVFCFVF